MNPIAIIQHAPNPPLDFVRGTPVIEGYIERAKRILMQSILHFPDGPKLWEELHRHALAHDASDDSVWLADFEKRILGSCSCRREWKKDLVELPPRFNDYFAWTVDQHNRINARLGKPLMTVEEAQKRWAV